MTLYRAINRLYAGENVSASIDERGYVQPGSLTQLEWLNKEQINVLISRGAVAEVSPPPLSELPGWKLRAKKLKRIKIGDVVTFLTTPADEIAKRLKVTEKTIEKWRNDAESWMVVPPEEQR